MSRLQITAYFSFLTPKRYSQDTWKNLTNDTDGVKSQDILAENWRKSEECRKTFLWKFNRTDVRKVWEISSVSWHRKCLLSILSCTPEGCANVEGIWLYYSKERIIIIFGGIDMDYMILKEASAKWGVTPRWINYFCSGGRIPGPVKMGMVWLIPKSA